MEGLLADRVAVVTGAGSGIGRGIAMAMAQAGAVVMALDLDAAAAAATAALIGPAASHHACDVTDRCACDEVARLVEARHGRVDVLVNNAGIARRGSVLDADARRVWDGLMATNLGGAYNMVTAMADLLVEAGGAIVNLSSVQGFVAGSNLTAYSASKGAVRGLTTSLAAELGPRGVRVNAIAPGFVETAMTAGMQESGAYQARFGARVALGRPGAPEDIAMAAVFLASDMARYVTGVTLPVDGGYLCY